MDAQKFALEYEEYEAQMREEMLAEAAREEAIAEELLHRMSHIDW